MWENRRRSARALGIVGHWDWDREWEFSVEGQPVNIIICYLKATNSFGMALVAWIYSPFHHTRTTLILESRDIFRLGSTTKKPSHFAPVLIRFRCGLRLPIRARNAKLANRAACTSAKDDRCQQTGCGALVAKLWAPGPVRRPTHGGMGGRDGPRAEHVLAGRETDPPTVVATLLVFALRCSAKNKTIAGVVGHSNYWIHYIFILLYDFLRIVQSCSKEVSFLIIIKVLKNVFIYFQNFINTKDGCSLYFRHPWSRQYIFQVDSKQEDLNRIGFL